MTIDGGPVIGADGIPRCPWAAGDPLMRVYHDTEWGMPVRGERAVFERITLEAFQSGLSWQTILRKRPAFRAGFHGFDAAVIAAYTDDDVARLMADTGIVRNRAKILATLKNARATVAMRERGGLERLIEAHRMDDGHAPRTIADLQGQTSQSRALASDLRRNGFVFVGPTTAWALMQAVGLVDDHLVGCHRRGTRSLVTGRDMQGPVARP